MNVLSKPTALLSLGLATLALAGPTHAVDRAFSDAYLEHVREARAMAAQSAPAVTAPQTEHATPRGRERETVAMPDDWATRVFYSGG